MIVKSHNKYYDMHTDAWCMYRLQITTLLPGWRHIDVIETS